MASGANNTARQLGLATGIAGLGSIFQSKIQSTLTPLVAGTPASSHVHVWRGYALVWSRDFVAVAAPAAAPAEPARA